VVVVEAWFEPERWRPGATYLVTAETAGTKVARMSRSSVEDRLSVLEFHYLIGRPDGLEHRVETHELGLFTTDEMLGAFAAAGLEVVEHDPEGLTDRSLYVARAAT
jgi:hypothetical protein